MTAIEAFAQRHHVQLSDDSALGPVVRGEAGVIYQDAGPDGPRLLLRLDGPCEGLGAGLKRVDSDDDEAAVFWIPRDPMPDYCLTHQEAVALNVAKVPSLLERWARRHGVEVEEGVLGILIVAGEHGVLLRSADGGILLELHRATEDEEGHQARVEAAERAGLRREDHPAVQFEFDPTDGRLSRVALILAGVPGARGDICAGDVREAGAVVGVARGAAEGAGAA